MRRLWVPWIACALLGTACGGTSDDGLFGDDGSGTAGGAGTGTGGASASTGGTTGSTGGAAAVGGSAGVGTGGTGAIGTGGAGTGGAGTGGFGTGGMGTGGMAGSGGMAGFGASGSGGFGMGGTGGDPPIDCPVGQYRGDWSGPYTAFMLQVDASGTVEFTVDASGNVTGEFRGTSPSSSQADIVGTMNCATGMLSANLVDGSYRVSLPFPVTVRFTGTLNGTFDPGSNSFSGDWTVVESNAAYGGQGSWSAN